MNDTPPTFLAWLQTWGQQILHAWALAAVGVLIGMGQLLRSEERITWRLAVGRALTTGGLSMAAGAALVWAPGIPFVAQLGIAASLASLGAAGLERMFARFLGQQPHASPPEGK